MKHFLNSTAQSISVFLFKNTDISCFQSFEIQMSKQNILHAFQFQTFDQCTDSEMQLVIISLPFKGIVK